MLGVMKRPEGQSMEEMAEQEKWYAMGFAIVTEPFRTKKINEQFRRLMGLQSTPRPLHLC